MADGGKVKEVNKALLESLFYKGHEYREMLHILRSQYGFPIQGSIDGYSRKVRWLYVTRSKNLPDNIAANLDAVREYWGGGGG